MAPIFLHCVDSRLEENATWYGRLHLGPFPRHVALTLATALRRALLQDLPSPQIRAVELPNAPHEYSRLHGVHEPVLDLLLQFRKVALVRTESQGASSRSLATFAVRGPGVLQAKDLQLPAGYRCRNPELVLAHLAPGALLEGRALITVDESNRLAPLPGAPYPSPDEIKRTKEPRGNWLAVGGSLGPVQRVSFRIEDAGPLDSSRENTELVIFEIATNGSLSPLQAFRHAAERLVRLFSGLLRLSIGVTPMQVAAAPQPLARARQAGSQSFPTTRVPLLQQSLQGYRRFADPLGLDLGNLDLSLETYQYLRQKGIQTVGELLRRLQSSSLLTPIPTVQRQAREEQRKQALVQLGIGLGLSLFVF